MSKINSAKILLKNAKIEPKKLDRKAAQQYLQAVKAKQDQILGLKELDEKSLETIVKL